MKNVRLASKNLTVSVASLAWPILIGQLAGIANPVLDTIMVARFSATDLAALAIGASIYVSVYVAFNGVMQSLTPTFGQMYGAGKFADIGREVKQGVWLAVFLSVIGSLILFFPAPLLSIAKAPPELAEKATLYLRILAFSLPASLNFLVYLTLNNAIARPKMVMAIQVSALFIKVPLNTIFIFGWFGMPALGGPGCALATLCITWFMLTTGWLILKINPFYRFLHLFGTGFALPSWKSLKELLRLGVPLGLNYFIEVTSFTFMALFIARIGVDTVAGHQIIANFSTVLYMLPLATANATSTLVAQSIGAGNILLARQIAFSGQRLAGCIALFVAINVWFFSEYIVSTYTSDQAIAANALPLLIFVCCYQFFDSIQVTSAHILRAYKVVLAPTILYVMTLWCIGLGGGYIFAFNIFDLDLPSRITGAAGFWFSNGISLVLLAIFLFLLLKKVEKRAAQQHIT
ncbi:MATE family efflux transporter [Oxalobacter sp. OttesenSCG-928-P03]|nr:MATE family efflux transporter [Oxalobacter sp. OttesenSCG-928-P03]